MTQEEKELLLKDLCARLPYGVKVKNRRKREPVTLSLDVMTYFLIGCSVKPYLRPISSMTEEEQKEFVKFHCVNICPIVLTDMLTLGNESKMFDWLNTHHFDYRGLIPMGLGLEAPKDMYNTKTE